jgi:hypothetical protein
VLPELPEPQARSELQEQPVPRAPPERKELAEPSAQQPQAQGVGQVH